MPSSPRIDHPAPDATLHAQRAPVTPRAQRIPDGERLPLEQLIMPFVTGGATGVIHLRGEPGSGRSTALAHLAAALPTPNPVKLLDAHELYQLETASRRWLVIAAGGATGPRTLAELQLSAWGEDELIEYLLARHRGMCRSVMSRVRADGERLYLRGSPQLWRIVLDTMAGDESIRYVASAIRRYIDAQTSRSVRRLVAREALQSVTRAYGPAPAAPDVGPDLARLLRHRCVKVMLAAEHVVELLEDRGDAEAIKSLPQDVLGEAALLARSRPLAGERLEELVRAGADCSAATAASILIRVDASWRPKNPRAASLSRAELAGVRWEGIDLSESKLMLAILSDADLRQSTLHGANFAAANLHAANLAYSKGDQVHFELADLQNARLDGCSLVFANFHKADLRHARLIRADLAGANLTEAQLAGADFTAADLTEAILDELVLRECRLDGATFRDASMCGCDLEEIELAEPDLTGAKLTGAMLTGSLLPRARLRGASLKQAGLADIRWEGADLRGVDFTAASFHLGSTRAGLVHSSTPCEGSRTGFYTDDFIDRAHVPPEEIRKADLRGADLRGAIVQGTDWYLVDLRDAKYTPGQAAHFQSCGAIL